MSRLLRNKTKCYKQPQKSALLQCLCAENAHTSLTQYYCCHHGQFLSSPRLSAATGP
jgi:hypothetical protein